MSFTYHSPRAVACDPNLVRSEALRASLEIFVSAFAGAPVHDWPAAQPCCQLAEELGARPEVWVGLEIPEARFRRVGDGVEVLPVAPAPLICVLQLAGWHGAAAALEELALDGRLAPAELLGCFRFSLASKSMGSACVFLRALCLSYPEGSAERALLALPHLLGADAPPELPAVYGAARLVRRKRGLYLAAAAAKPRALADPGAWAGLGVSPLEVAASFGGEHAAAAFAAGATWHAYAPAPAFASSFDDLAALERVGALPGPDFPSLAAPLDRALADAVGALLPREELAAQVARFRAAGCAFRIPLTAVIAQTYAFYPWKVREAIAVLREAGYAPTAGDLAGVLAYDTRAGVLPDVCAAFGLARADFPPDLLVKFRRPWWCGDHPLAAPNEPPAKRARLSD